MSQTNKMSWYAVTLLANVVPDGKAARTHVRLRKREEKIEYKQDNEWSGHNFPYVSKINDCE